MKIMIGACVVVFLLLLALLGNILEDSAFARGVKSVPAKDCTSEVSVAEQGAYGQGVTDTVKSVQVYIMDSCTQLKELTVAGETFVCLKKQEM